MGADRHQDPAWLRAAARHWAAALEKPDADVLNARWELERIQDLAAAAGVALPEGLPRPRRLPAAKRAFWLGVSDMDQAGLAVVWREDLEVLLEVEAIARELARGGPIQLKAALDRLDAQRALESEHAWAGRSR